MKNLKITKVQENPVNGNTEKEITAYMIKFTLDGVDGITELIRYYEDDTFYLNCIEIDGEALRVRPGVMSDASDVKEENWDESFKRFKSLEDNTEFTLALLQASAAFENLDGGQEIEANGLTELLGDTVFSYTPYICDECIEETMDNLKDHYVGKEVKANDLWNGYGNDDVHDVEIIDVEYDGDEFIDLILNKPVLVDRLRWIKEEFADVSGFPDAGFTEIGMMEEGRIRFAIFGW